MEKVMMKTVRVMIIDSEDRGVSTPNSGYNVLIKNPINIKINKLDPMVYRNIFPQFSTSKFKSRRKIVPGMNNTKKTPTISLNGVVDKPI
jgi:hypothetical protein